MIDRRVCDKESNCVHENPAFDKVKKKIKERLVNKSLYRDKILLECRNRATSLYSPLKICGLIFLLALNQQSTV